MTLRIDQIAVRRGAGFGMLQPHQWAALPVAERRELLLNNAVEFLANGKLVDFETALRALRHQTGGSGDDGSRAASATARSADEVNTTHNSRGRRELSLAFFVGRAPVHGGERPRASLVARSA